MKRVYIFLVLLCTLLSGCFPRQSELPAEPATAVPLKEILATALVNTQEAEKTQFSPPFPYTPAQLATLLEPGADLEGRWTASSVTDLTQPIPGYACSGYYGSCWGDWARDISYGSELELLLDGNNLGETAFLYFDNLAAVDTAYQLFFSNWSSWEENQDEIVNQTWMQHFNPYNRDPVGEKWLHFVGYSLYDESTSTDPEEREERELQTIQIIFTRCQGFVIIELRFPVQAPWNSPEDNTAERIQEQEDRFNLTYAYARSVDERITPYACNP